MRFAVITLVPGMIRAQLAHGIQGRAVARGLVEVETWNPRDYTRDRHGSVDDRPYGGGPGMVMQVQPVADALRAARVQGKGPVIYMSPQGRRLDQRALRRFAGYDHIVLLAGRYEGIDEPLIETEVDEEWSIGDKVLCGGDPAAIVWIDSLARLIPGVLGDEESALQDSFMDGLLDYPHYTRPEVVEGRAIPAVLSGGNHAEIERWRMKQSLGRTWERRPDLLEQLELGEDQQSLLEEYISGQGGSESE